MLPAAPGNIRTRSSDPGGMWSVIRLLHSASGIYLKARALQSSGGRVKGATKFRSWRDGCCGATFAMGTCRPTHGKFIRFIFVEPFPGGTMFSHLRTRPATGAYPKTPRILPRPGAPTLVRLVARARQPHGDWDRPVLTQLTDSGEAFPSYFGEVANGPFVVARPPLSTKAKDSDRTAKCT